MTPSSHPRGTVTYAAAVVAVLALFVAATSTAFAAGLAKNSVGTKQLKANAVRTADIKNGAVTGSKLAAGVLPLATTYVNRNLGLSDSTVTLANVNGAVFAIKCHTLGSDTGTYSVAGAGGVGLSHYGSYTWKNNLGQEAFPAFEENVAQLAIVQTNTNGGVAIMDFDGVVTAVGQKPVSVRATIRVVDNAPTPCKVRLALTPQG